MSTNPKANNLALVIPRQEITEAWAQQAMQNANGQYEALWDTTAPGGSAQVFCGHDHTPNGGGPPIHRGCLWSACTTSTELVERAFTSANQALELIAASKAIDTMQIHPSPGLRVGALLTGWICYYARNSDKFTLQMAADGTIYDVELPVAQGETYNWFQFQLPVAYPGLWRARNLIVKCGSYDSSNAPAFTLYALQIDELPDVIDRRGVPVQQSTTVTSGPTIISSFGVLDDALVDADEWLDAYVLRELYGFENALFEGLEEKRAPLASSQVCRGHDHDTSGYGGRAIARGGCYTASLHGTTYLYRLAYDGTSYSGYYAWDFDDGSDRRSNNSVGMALFWVSPGINNSNSPPTNPPYLTARLYVEWDAGGSTPTVNIRAVNITISKNSAVTTISSSSSHSAWITIDKIPCSGDALNELQFELEMTGASATVNIDLYGFVVYEVPGVGARTNTSLVPLGSGGVT